MPPFLLGGGGEPPTKFSKGGGLDRASTFRGGLLGKSGITFFGGGEIKQVYKQKYFSVITKNSNWEILTKNLVTFKI